MDDADDHGDVEIDENAEMMHEYEHEYYPMAGYVIGRTVRLLWFSNAPEYKKFRDHFRESISDGEYNICNAIVKVINYKSGKYLAQVDSYGTTGPKSRMKFEIPGDAKWQKLSDEYIEMCCKKFQVPFSDDVFINNIRGITELCSYCEEGELFKFEGGSFDSLGFEHKSDFENETGTMVVYDIRENTWTPDKKKRIEHKGSIYDVENGIWNVLTVEGEHHWDADIHDDDKERLVSTIVKHNDISVDELHNLEWIYYLCPANGTVSVFDEKYFGDEDDLTDEMKLVASESSLGLGASWDDTIISAMHVHNWPVHVILTHGVTFNAMERRARTYFIGVKDGKNVAVFFPNVW
jgi:hypothetical protein